jgi:uncharacterized protein YbcI
MKSPGEIEAAVCVAVTRFEREFMGRGPRHVDAHLIGNRLLVRLEGSLTAAEEWIIAAWRRGDADGRGAELLKQLRSHLVSAGRPILESLLHDATGTPTVGMHYDISPTTGEEVLVLTLASAPECRARRRG